MDGQGAINSTNTYEHMPTANSVDMKMGPDRQIPSRRYRTGVRLFHFNAAKPITKFIG